jgi:hypothetical protein
MIFIRYNQESKSNLLKMCTPPHTLNGAKTFKINKKCDTPLQLYNPFNNSKFLKKMKFSNLLKNVYPTL